MKQYGEVFWHFLTLGCLSFGGPAAHIGYFHKHFVEKLKWIDEETFANYLALSQFLPGPSSSQLGFSIGMHRAGRLGGLMAFLGFTLPSFVIMYFVALYSMGAISSILNGEDVATGFEVIVIALKLLAVVIVLDAIITMAKHFCQNHFTKIIALSAAVFLLLYQSIISQLFVMLMAAFLAYIMNKVRPSNQLANQLINHQASHRVTDVTDGKRPRFSKQIMVWILPVAAVLVLPVFLGDNNPLAWFAKFFSAGGLVFGGGHVVLPLLQQLFVTDIGYDEFMTGYAVAQALPGPLFTFATYLGTVLGVGMGVDIGLSTGIASFMIAIMATAAIFLPGFILLLLFSNHWQYFAKQASVKSIMSAVNAAVVGMLLAAWINPIATSGVKNSGDIIIVVLGFVFLRWIKWPILWVIFAMIGLVFLRSLLFS